MRRRHPASAGPRRPEASRGGGRWRSVPSPAEHLAAVEGEDLAGDVVAGEKHERGSDLLGLGGRPSGTGSVSATYLAIWFGVRAEAFSFACAISASPVVGNDATATGSGWGVSCRSLIVPPPVCGRRLASRSLIVALIAHHPLVPPRPAGQSFPRRDVDLTARVALASLAVRPQGFELWLDDTLPGTVSPVTEGQYQDVVRLYIAPRMGRIRLEQLAPSDVTRMLRDMETPTAPDRTGTARTAVSMLHGEVDDLVEDRLEILGLCQDPRDPRPPACTSSADRPHVRVGAARPVTEHVDGRVSTVSDLETVAPA